LVFFLCSQTPFFYCLDRAPSVVRGARPSNSFFFFRILRSPADADFNSYPSFFLRRLRDQGLGSAVGGGNAPTRFQVRCFSSSVFSPCVSAVALVPVDHLLIIIQLCFASRGEVFFFLFFGNTAQEGAIGQTPFPGSLPPLIHTPPVSR